MSTLPTFVAIQTISCLFMNSQQLSNNSWCSVECILWSPITAILLIHMQPLNLMTISKEWGYIESLLHWWVACFPTYHEMILLPRWTLWRFHCITLAVVGDAPQVILMLVEGWIEETWKIVIQSDASKGGIRSDLNSKGDLDCISWQNLEDFQIQRMCSHIWRTAAIA